VSALAGHLSRQEEEKRLAGSTWDIYGHLFTSSQRDAADKMDEILDRSAVNLAVGEHAPSNSKEEVIEKVGRGEWIRTTDLLVPNQAL
jgi:hypothetical protein